MLSSIHPLGERAKGNRFGVTATAHVLGAALGGALTGAALGLLGAALASARSPAVASVAAALACLAALVADRSGRVPTVRRQVDERWLDEYRGTVYGFGYGVQLGAGLVTIVTSATTYAAFACALLVGSTPAGAAIGATFGTVRGLALLTARRLDTPADLRRFHRRLAAGAAPARAVATAALAVASASLLAAAAVGAP